MRNGIGDRAQGAAGPAFRVAFPPGAGAQRSRDLDGLPLRMEFSVVGAAPEARLAIQYDQGVDGTASSDDRGLPRSASWHAGATDTTTTWGYDARGAVGLTRTEWANRASYFSIEGQRDRAGRLTRRFERSSYVVGTGTVTHSGDGQAYRYDAFGRLCWTGTGIEPNLDPCVVGIRPWQWDDNNNLLVSPDGPSGTAVVDAQDRLRSWGEWRFEYDAHGERSVLWHLQTVVHRYTWDALGQLRRVAVLSGDGIQGFVEYEYDGLGRMVERRWRDNMTEWQRRRWLYRDGLRPLAEVDEQGAVQWVYVWGTQGNLPDLARGPHGELYRLLGDERGSLRLVVDTRDGRVVLDRDYNLLGQVTAVSGPTDSIARALPFGYEGGFTDEVTGLVRFGARWYDPRVGRWLSRDPLGFGGGDQNQYAFVHGDPVNRTDFNGMLSSDDARFGVQTLVGLGGLTPLLANPGVAAGAAVAGVATGVAIWGGVAYYLGPRVWNGLQSWLNQCPRPEASGGRPWDIPGIRTPQEPPAPVAPPPPHPPPHLHRR